ncbi:MAG: hypothetical protein AABZ31_12855 [Bdellovibrionota bacterium]
MKLVTALLLLCFVFKAQAEIGSQNPRKMGFFYGGGMQKSLANIKDTAGEAQFEGWGYSLEAGFDLPFDRTFGATLAGEYKAADLTNKQKTDDAIEDADLKSTTIKAGFFFKNFGFGYGQSKDKAEIRQVSTTTGSSKSHISGDITEIYANYNIQVQDDFRITFDIQKRDGDLDNYKLDEIKILMKFFVLTAL